VTPRRVRSLVWFGVVLVARGKYVSIIATDGAPGMAHGPAVSAATAMTGRIASHD